MSLSDKRWKGHDPEHWNYSEEDVAEAVKELKEEVLEWDWQAVRIIELINKKFGEKLI